MLKDLKKLAFASGKLRERHLSKASSVVETGVKAIGSHLKNQAGKHGVLPVAASLAGGAVLASSAVKVPSNYQKFKAGFKPENHPYR